MDEDILAEFDAAPVTNLSGETIGTIDAGRCTFVGYLPRPECCEGQVSESSSRAAAAFSRDFSGEH
jgi:hypothetical protein